MHRKHLRSTLIIDALTFSRDIFQILYNDHGEPISRTDHIADINRLLDLADFRKVALVWIYASHLIKEVPADGKAR